MNEQQNTMTVTPVKKFSRGILALLAVGAAGLASAAPFTVMQLDGHKAVSVSSSENKLAYVTIPAASLGIVTRGSIDSRLSVSAKGSQDVSFNVNHARNEAGTLFVYLDVKTGINNGFHRKLPLTITNSVTGKSVTVDAQVNALAARFR
jgi:hypothetical protein